MIRKIAAAVAAVAAAGVLGLGSQAALAAPAPAYPASAVAAAGPTASQAKAWVARQVRGLLKDNPGARQISSNAVRYKGAILGVTPPRQPGSAAPYSASQVCPGDYLCLFWDIDFNGYSIDSYWIKFYNCGVNYNLYYYRSQGVSWANQASSIDYPGTANGHIAKFNHNGNWWLQLYRDHYLRDLTLNGGPNPHGNSNDWITGLYAC
jgi:hypothetical protein